MPEAVVASSARFLQLELELFLEALLRGSNIDLRGYKPALLQQRLQAAMRAEGLASVTQLLERYLHFEDGRQRILDQLLTRTPRFFERPATMRALRERVMPFLRTYPTLRIWLLGAGTGQEAYALAIALREEGLLARTRLYVSDPNEAALDVARRGRYPSQEVIAAEAAYADSGGPGTLRSSFALHDGWATALPELRAPMYFMPHGLTSDQSPNEFQLILCRNVLDCFDRPLQERAFHVLEESLMPFGVLSLGSDERPLSGRFHELSAGAGLYRRID